MRTIGFISIIVGLISCQTPANREQEEIFSEVINETIDRVTKDFVDLEGYTEVVVNPFDDHLDSLAIVHVKNDTSRQIHPQTLDLLNKLEKILNDPLSVDFQRITSKQKIRLINSMDTLGYNFDKNEFRGYSFISNVATNENKDTGVFYMDLQLGKGHGAGGYLVFVTKEKDSWKIFTVWQVWE